VSIVGAPRCGTTSLSRWLAEHPDVCFSEPKETHFFSWNDLRGLDKSKLAALVRHHYLDKYFADVI
jgi:cytidylate kinase